MKLAHVAALALLAAAPTLASAASFKVDFENTWNYDQPVANTYASQGVSFVNVSGLSNDPAFPYYAGAPSPLGVAYAHDTAYLDAIGGFDKQLTFWYSSADDIVGAIQLYSGLDGSGTLLGSWDLTATGNGDLYDSWKSVTITFQGTAQSVQFAAGNIAYDDISAVPEAGSMAMMLAGVGLLAGVARRRRA